MSKREVTPRCRRSPEEIAELLSEYHRSDLTQQAFADSKNVSLSSLTVWLRKDRQRWDEGQLSDAGRRLVPVHVRESTGSGFELLIPGGATLRIPVDFDEIALRRLLELIESRC